MTKPEVLTIQEIESYGTALLRPNMNRVLGLVPIQERRLRLLFDAGCDQLHYAKACQRVGRCMRLAITVRGRWAGGMVLGSTFPNIRCRDDAFGLTQFVHDWKTRGLPNPWASENDLYWKGLQRIVNHARTFIFPSFAGRGLGIEAHKLLLTEGASIWKSHYGEFDGFDTLCTEPKSKLFLANGWSLVGRTQGFSRDPNRVLSRRVAEGRIARVADNAGLTRQKGATRWWVWVRPLDDRG